MAFGFNFGGIEGGGGFGFPSPQEFLSGGFLNEDGSFDPDGPHFGEEREANDRIRSDPFGLRTPSNTGASDVTNNLLQQLISSVDFGNVQSAGQFSAFGFPGTGGTAGIPGAAGTGNIPERLPGESDESYARKVILAQGGLPAVPGTTSGIGGGFQDIIDAITDIGIPGLGNVGDIFTALGKGLSTPAGRAAGGAALTALFGGGSNNKFHLGIANPSAFDLGDIFGTTFTENGFVRTGPSAFGDIQQRIQASVDKERELSFLEIEGEKLAGEALEFFPIASELFDVAIDTATEQTQTGFRSDVTDSIQPLADNQFERFIAQTKENVQGSLGGINNSSFVHEIGRGAGDLAAQIGSLQLQEDQFSDTLRSQGAPLLASLLGARNFLPISMGDALQDIGQQNRLAQLEQEFIPFNMLSALSGIGSQLDFTAPSFNNQSTFADIISAMVNATSGGG